MPTFGFFFAINFLKKQLFTLNQLLVKFIYKSLLKIWSCLCQEKFSNFGVYQNHFPKFECILLIFNLNGITQRFCEIITLTNAFNDSV